MIETSLDWRSVATRGVAAVVFGVLTLLWPGLTVAVLVVLFGAFALVDGIVHLMAALGRGRSRDRRGILILDGVIGVLAGAVAIIWPGITALALLYLIAAWAILSGVFRIMLAVEVRRQISNEWFLVASGALSIIFGIILVVAPVAGALAITWLIGFYALLLGFFLLALAWRLRKAVGRIQVRVVRPVSEATA